MTNNPSGSEEVVVCSDAKNALIQVRRILTRDSIVVTQDGPFDRIMLVRITCGF